MGPPMNRRPRSRRLLVGALALLSLLALLPGFGLASAEPDDPLDDPGQKAADLARAKANGGRSVDRVVVVYANGPGRDHPTRARVRQRAGGKLVQADRAVGRDVIRVAGGDAD